MTRKVKFVGVLEAGCVYLTAGKVYDVLEDGIFGESDEEYITIIDDTGEEVFENVRLRYHAGTDGAWVFL